MATRRVREGQKFLLPQSTGQPPKFVHLFSDEVAALQMLADGKDNQEVRNELGSPADMVRTVRDMLGASTTTHAVAIALRTGIIR